MTITTVHDPVDFVLQELSEARLTGRAQQARASEAVAAAPAPAAEPDVMDQPSRLGELRVRGVLTEGEFAREQAKILGGSRG